MFEPRHPQAEPFAQVEGCRVERLTGRRGPQIELVPRRAASEAAVHVLTQIRRKGATSQGARLVNRSAAAKLVTRCFGCHEAQEVQHFLETHFSTQSPKINRTDARPSRHREEEPVVRRLALQKLVELDRTEINDL